MDKLHWFTRPISPACDQYVQYLLTGPTHRSLTNTGGGYNLGGVDLPHHTPRPSQSTILRFSPKSLAWSQVNHPTFFSNYHKGEQALILVSGTFYSTSTIIYYLSLA
jgi:hypothetical protein